MLARAQRLSPHHAPLLNLRLQMVENDTDGGEVSQLLLSVFIHAGNALMSVSQCNVKSDAAVD